MDEYVEKRMAALEWWETLRKTDLRSNSFWTDTKDRGYYTRKYYPERKYQWLTGREIQKIWESEVK